MPRFVGTVADDLGQRTPFDLAVTLRARPTLLPQEFGNPDLDQTAAVTAWVKAQPAGTRVDMAGAAVRLDRTVSLSSLVDFEMYGGTFFRDTVDPAITNPAQKRALSLLRFYDCRGLKLDLTIRGENALGGVAEGAYDPAKEARHLVELSWCTDVTFGPHTRLTNSFGDCVYYGYHQKTGQWCKNVVHEPGGVYGLTGRQVFGVTGLDGGVWRGLTLLDARRADWDAEPQERLGGCNNLLIEDCNVGWTRANVIAATSAWATVSGVTIRRLRMRPQGPKPPGPQVHSALKIYVNTGPRSADWLIEDCGHKDDMQDRIGNPSGAAWYIGRVDGLTVRGNYQPVQTGRTPPMAGVGTKDCTGELVQGNNFPGAVEEWRRWPDSAPDVTLSEMAD